MSLFRKIVLGVLLSMALPSAARAACGSLPYSFTNNVSIVDATTVNANNNFLLGCATAVDSSQIGPAGIFASQLVPNSIGTATFGGSYGYRFSLASPSQPVLSLFGATSQTGDLFDIFSVGGSTKYYWVDNVGNVHAQNISTSSGVAASGTVSATQGLYAGQGSGLTPAGQVSLFTDGTNPIIRSGSGGVLQVQNAGGTASISVNALGYNAGSTNINAASATIAGPVTAQSISGVATTLPGLYASSGGGISGAHTVFGSQAITTSSGASGTLVGQAAVALTSSMYYTATNTFTIQITPDAAYVAIVGTKSVTGFTIYVYSFGSAQAAGTYNFEWMTTGY